MVADSCWVDAAVSLPPQPFSGCSGSLLPSPATNTAAAVLPPLSANWSPEHSAVLYRVDLWGAPYFSVNPNGNICVRPHGVDTLAHEEIDLLKVVKKASDDRSSGGLGLQLPLIVRFPDVLKNRLECLQSSFDIAIESLGYEAHYQGVYPVKCNQEKFVVDDIVRFGSSFRFGLEAGSKPELLLAMSSLCEGSPEALLVCNGFKDVEYISLALLAKKLGMNSIIVLEQVEELDAVIDVGQKLGVRPAVGVRAKLRTKHSGHFGSTSGEKGKFGLTTMQILRVVKKLQQHEMLDCLQLLHFHIGSQIPTTSLLADGVGEAAQIYCELVRFGASMRIIDIGGGLGIDYDGSKSGDSDLSVGYTLQEYASAVVEAVRLVCNSKGVRHPVICSESGRAIVSHHSILVFEAVSTSSSHGSPQCSSLGIQYLLSQLTGAALEHCKNLSAAASNGEYDGCLVHARDLKQSCVEQFKEGSLTMEQLSAVDSLCELVMRAVGVIDPISTYNVNLSIFTSIPDYWGIHQLFPILPIHRLDEHPTVRAILSDLTCDSDGKINKFIGGEASLPLHEISNSSAPYYLGMFLGGAYEEALGGFHNLFGGPSIIRVSQSDGPHGFSVTHAVPGPSTADVLQLMQYQPELMFQTLKQRIEEQEDDDDDGEDGLSTAELVDGVARSFGNMPYLTATSSSTCYYTGSFLNTFT
ncbi:arginine decarboxylase-like [Andrographis paniculata]|uniref:arginine decarboxylase-like n=1 Tax=Andrographis paniculata TaxID=175694 RepID=UPI0021E8EFC3|nr:arginine decarboxylase-like [Andrographis paniculata]